MTKYSSVAGMEEWLEATKEMIIEAYIDSADFTVARMSDEESLAKEDLEQAPEKGSRRQNIPIGENIRDAIRSIKGQ